MKKMIAIVLNFNIISVFLLSTENGRNKIVLTYFIILEKLYAKCFT